MRTNNITMKSLIVLLVLTTTSFLTAFGATGSVTFNGLPASSGSSLSDSDDDLDVVFSYSSGDANNAFIINGVTVPLTLSGWFNDLGVHTDGNTNYICGPYGEYGVYHNFFAVDLSNLSSYGISTPITSAVLHINRYESEPPTGYFKYVLSQVTTGYSTINQGYSAGAAGISIFDDLGGGTVFATAILDKTVTSGTYENITLNSAGIAAMNSSVGSTFVLGGSGSAVAVPVPYWAIALVFIAIGLFVVIRFRKRKQMA